MTKNYETVRIAVAFVVSDQKRLLLAWNDAWQAFTLPMTKLTNVPPPPETPDHAATRAAAEVLQLPVRIIAGKPSKEMRKVEMSGRDGKLRDYLYTVVPIEVHPDFVAMSRDHRPAIYFPVEKLVKDVYQPVSPTVKPVLAACKKWGWL